MQKARSFLTSPGSRLAIVVVVLGGTLGLLAPVKDAQSSGCAWRPIYRSYFSDAAHTNLVGQRGLNCNCDDASWGITTSYSTYVQQCCTVNTC